MGAKTLTLSDASFDETVKGSSTPVLVDFWAEWCGPCKQIAPVLEELAGDYEGKVAIGKLNIDDNLEITTRYDVQSIPTLILFKDGEPVARLVGARGKAALQEEISRHI
jgi:thioredoxin 1